MSQKKIRPRITSEEFALIELLRSHKDSSGIDIKNVKHGWIKGKDSALFFENPNYKKETFETFTERLKSAISEIAKPLESFKREDMDDPHLLVIDPADIHIGKIASAIETGEDYNSQIAVQRVKSGVSSILSKASGFNIDKILFIGGNDVLHIDSPRRTTTSGTPQDTDGMWYENFTTAFKLYTDILDELIKKAPVHFVFNPSNHDYMSGFMLCQAIKAYYRNNEDNITFDVSIAHRKYFTYGSNIIGSTHGDGAKEKDLALTMAHECKDWSKCDKRYFYTHHLHHKTAKDYMSVAVETLRSPSAADSWHHRNGYQHAPKAVEGFIHHPVHGQVSRITHFF